MSKEQSATGSVKDTPRCNALESNPLDSFDIRAWKTLAREFETLIGTLYDQMVDDDSAGAEATLRSARSETVALQHDVERAVANHTADLNAVPATPRKPVAWRYRYHHGVAGEHKGLWKYVDTEDECNQSPYYEREALYVE